MANKFTSVECCPPSPHLSAARIHVEGGKALVVVNMHVPVPAVRAVVLNLKPQTVATKQMMALVKGFCADNPEGTLLIMGDMNRSADALDKFIHSKKAMGMSDSPFRPKEPSTRGLRTPASKGREERGRNGWPTPAPTTSWAPKSWFTPWRAR